MVNICTIFDHIIGAVCPACHQPGPGLCDLCRRALPFNGPACPCCAQPLPDDVPSGIPCADCQARPPSFDRVLAPLLYQPPVDTLVAGLKYRGQLHLAPVLAGICAECIAADTRGVQLLLPIPMRAQGLRERGFNQAAELARQLSRRFDIPWVADRLLKVSGGRHQQSLDRVQRRRNIRGTFTSRGRLPASVALVDDVVTTGATVEEASRVLRRAGVERIEVWAIARTPRDRWAGAGRADRRG